MKQEYIVACSYDMQYYPAYDKIVENKAGMLCTGSGAGCGERDMDWILSLDKAVEVFKKLVKLKNLKNITLTKCY